MLVYIIIIRCAIIALLAALIPILHTQIHRLINHEDFNAWQVGFLTSLLIIFVDYHILSQFYITWIQRGLILIDIIVCGIIMFIIKGQAITKAVARTQMQQVIQSYVTSKVALLTTMYAGVGISNVSECTQDSFLESIALRLHLYELYEISVQQYINDVIIAKYNQTYAMSTLLSLLVASLIAYFAVRWFMQAVVNMRLKYKYIYSMATALLVSQYNLLLFSETNPIDSTICYSIVYTVSLILWWWFVDSEFDPERELRIQHSKNCYK